MTIEYKDIKFSKVDFQAEELSKFPAEDLNIDLDFTPSFSNERDFYINFTLNLKKENSSLLSLEAKAYFRTDQDMNEDFKASHFININAPAIAYPYIRAFVSTITVNSGYNSVILSVFNFVARAEEKKKQLAQ